MKDLCANHGRECWTSSSLAANRGQSRTRLSAKCASINLPPDEKELALESARLADLCQYFSPEKMNIPSDLLDRIGRVSTMQAGERVPELLSINQALMEYLNRVGSGPHLWQ